MNLKWKILTTVGVCLAIIFFYLSRESAIQNRREAAKQAAIRAFDKQQEEEEAVAAANRPKPAVEKETNAVTTAATATPEERFDAQEEIANFRSSETDVVFAAVEQLRRHKACQAVPGLRELLQTASDDLLAGEAARSITLCKADAVYGTIVDEFLKRKPSVPMIEAVGETNRFDESIFRKLNSVIQDESTKYPIANAARRTEQKLKTARLLLEEK